LPIVATGCIVQLILLTHICAQSTMTVNACIGAASKVQILCSDKCFEAISAA